MRTFISFVALSTAMLAQSATVAFAGPERTSKSQSTTVCTERTIGRNGIQANWQGSSEWPVVLTPFDFNGNPIAPASIHFGLNSPSHILNSGGVGQISPTGQGEYTDNRRFEFARRNNKSEKLRVDFGAVAMSYGGGLKKAQVTVSRFYIDGGNIRERGRWVALDESFNPVAPTTPGSDLFYGQTNWGSNNPGLVSFTVQTNLPFRYLEFMPLEGVQRNNLNIPVNSTTENSDFMVRQIVIEFCEPQNPPTCEDKVVSSSNALFTGTGLDGEPVVPTFVANPVLGGWGITSSNPADNGPFKPELGWRMINGVGVSEKLAVTVGGASSPFIGATVKLARFYKEFGAIERGHYQLIDTDGNLIDEVDGGFGTFLATEPNVAGNPGHFEFTFYSSRPFSAIIFTANQWVNGVGNPLPTVSNDNSDYHVNKITLLCERLPVFCNDCDARIGEEGDEDAWRSQVGIAATDYNGNPVDVNFPADASWRPNSKGMGVLSPSAPEVAGTPKFELGFRSGKTETVTLNFGECGDFTVAQIRLARFYVENGLIERGKVTAYASDMTPLGTKVFEATEQIGANGPGYLTFTVETATKFQYLKFEAMANKRASDDAIIATGSDNSDYLIRDIVLLCTRPIPCGENLCRPDDEAFWFESDFVDVSAETFGTEMTPGAPIAPYFLADGVNWRPASGGLGVLSPGAPETAATAKFELGYRDFKSEKLTLDFAKSQSFKKIIVKLARFYVENGKREQGFWKAFDRDGNEVGRGNFLGTQPLSGPGYHDVTIETTEPMSRIEFTAGPNVNVSNGLPNESISDNSDYLIRCYFIPCPPTNGGGVGFDAQENVANPIASSQLSVYPNPAVDQISISMDSDIDGPVHYAIRDLSGKVVKEATWSVEAGANKTSLPVADLNNGMYLLSVRQGEQVRNTKFMIKK